MQSGIRANLATRCSSPVAPLRSTRVRAQTNGIKRSEPFQGAHAGTPRFNLRVEYAGLLFLSGLADDRQPRAMHPGDYKAQTQLTLFYLDQQLAKAGIDKRRVLKVVVYLRDIEEGFQGMNEAWDEWKDPEHLPARTTVEARLIRPDLLVEIDVTAALQPQ